MKVNEVLKVVFKLDAIMSVLVGIVLSVGCSTGLKVEPVPQPPVQKKEPTIEELRKPVAIDVNIYKAEMVINKFGRLKKKSITYQKYQQLTGGKEDAVTDPDWFYDTYVLDFNEDGYWVTVSYGTARRAKEKDPMIAHVMGDLPEKSITVSLITPSNQKYILLDANADGVLDFVRDAKNKSDTKIDIALLDKMQERYTWLLYIIKKNYKKP